MEIIQRFFFAAISAFLLAAIAYAVMYTIAIELNASEEIISRLYIISIGIFGYLLKFSQDTLKQDNKWKGSLETKQD